MMLSQVCYKVLSNFFFVERFGAEVVECACVIGLPHFKVMASKLLLCKLYLTYVVNIKFLSHCWLSKSKALDKNKSNDRIKIHAFFLTLISTELVSSKFNSLNKNMIHDKIIGQDNRASSDP